jgi:hypothetical protein
MAGRMSRTALLLLPCALLLGMIHAPVLHADNAISETSAPTPQGKFPNEIDFAATFASTAGQINDIEIHYALEPNGVLTSAKADFTPGATAQATFVLRTSGNPLYVPPSKVIGYYWTAQDAAGNTLQTDQAMFEFDDTRFAFKKLVNGNLTLYYYTGSDSAAQNILTIGRQALDRAGQLNNAPVDFDVHLVVYGSQSDILAALSHELQGGDPNVLGQANPPNIVVLDAGNLTGSDNEDTVRHELTHLVNARAVQGPFKDSLPLWLDEGLAVYSQTSPGGFQTAVTDAIRANQVVPITGLTPGFRGVNPDLFYGESWSIAKFLATGFGDGKIAALLAQFKAGKTQDAAFQAVYNMNSDGIYNAWRKSVGLNPAAAAPSQPPNRPSQQQAAPSIQPTVAGAQSSGSNAPITDNAPLPHGKNSTSDNNALVIVIASIAGAAALLALLGIAVIGGLALSRRGRS